jgi:hypothetical protein
MMMGITKLRDEAKARGVKKINDYSNDENGKIGLIKEILKSPEVKNNNESEEENLVKDVNSPSLLTSLEETSDGN